MAGERKPRKLRKKTARRYCVTVITDFGGVDRKGCRASDASTNRSALIVSRCRNFFTPEAPVLTTNSSERASDPTVSFSGAGFSVVDSPSVLNWDTFAASDGSADL